MYTSAMKKYLLYGSLAAFGIIMLIVWLRGAPSDNFAPEPTEPPPMLDVSEKPQAKVQNQLPIVKGNMKIETIKEGTGQEITNGQTAIVQYTGMLTDGTVFDATSKRGGAPFSFTLGAGQVIRGWDQGVLGMKIGETRKLTIPADLGYGAGGIPGVIPPNATLVFEVTLEGIK